jgi:hypothetical protein
MAGNLGFQPFFLKVLLVPRKIEVQVSIVQNALQISDGSVKKIE